jgi:pyridoxamine 5'-phosphate oxidase
MSDYEVHAGAAGPDVPLPAMRVRYTPGPLHEADVAESPFVQVRRWLAEAVAAGLPEPNAMVLATAGVSGVVSSRHVLLKELDDVGFVFYTNLASRKASQLAEQPYASLCFPWYAISRQVSVEGAVTLLDRASVAQYWHRRPRESQLGAWASDQSQPVESREALRARLAKVSERFGGVEAIPVPEQWGGYRVVPHRVELWQGQPARLHDRLVYLREDGVPGTEEGATTWRLVRLQP